MKKYSIVLIILIFSGFYTSVLGADADIEEQPSNIVGSIEYTVSISSTTCDNISVNLRITRLPEARDTANPFIAIYKGNVDFRSLEIVKKDGERIPYRQSGEKMSVVLTEDHIDIKYEVHLGHLAKHGSQGIQTGSIVAFAGEHIFLIVLQDFVKDMKVKFNMPKGWSGIIPESKNPGEKGYGWFEMFSLLKNCYAFGSFEKKAFRVKGCALNVYFSRKELHIDEQDKFAGGCLKLYDYYCQLFNSAPKKYNIVLMNMTKEGERVFCGSGDSCQGSSITDTMKDWQLLSHRMFHSFFDNIVRVKEIHLPPQDWLMEAMATYYENKSLDSIGDVRFSSREAFAELFRRYLYFRIIIPNLLVKSPKDEKTIESRGKMEFVHYAQAPLVLYALERHLKSIYGGLRCDFLLNWCIENRDEPGRFLDILQALNESVGGKLEDFIKKYIQLNDIIPLWDCFPGLKEDPGEIVKSLKDFDEIMYSWFLMDNLKYDRPDIKYIKYSSADDKLHDIINKDVHFATPEIEERIMLFSPVLHALLVQFFSN